MHTLAATPTPLCRVNNARVPRLAPAKSPQNKPAPAGIPSAGWTVQLTENRTRPGPPQAQPRVTSRPVQTVLPARRLGVRGRWAPLLCLVIVLVDQASKAVQPAGAFIVNTGGWSFLPAALGDAPWKSQTFGAACDTVDTVLLLAGLRVAVRLANPRQRVAATAVLAGLLSNLVDRLGGASLFHPGLPRGAIDWINLPAWPIATTTNIADIVVVLGAFGLAYQPACQAIHTVQVLTRRSRAARLAAVTTGLVAVAIWTTFWQANRHTAELRMTARSEAAAHCAAASYPSEGMDWVSNRPTAGPLPYHPPTPRRGAIPGCVRATTRAVHARLTKAGDQQLLARLQADHSRRTAQWRKDGLGMRTPSADRLPAHHPGAGLNPS